MWDYLKSLTNYDVRQTANLAKLYAMLIGKGDIPLHFLKVLKFEEEEGLSKPQELFLYILFDALFEDLKKEEIKTIFKKGFKPSSKTH